jgi:hypothetical protein
MFKYYSHSFFNSATVRTRNVRSTSPHVALSVSSLNYCFELLGIATYRE